MNYKLILALSFGLYFSIALSKNYLDYLPQDALIKNKIQNCRKSWLCKNDYQKACEYIAVFLKKYDDSINGNEKRAKDCPYDLLSFLRMEDAVWLILKKYPFEVKLENKQHVYTASQKIAEEKLKKLKSL